FTVRRIGSTATDLTVFYDVTGTATAGSDYTALLGSVTIPNGSAAANIIVTPINDTATEGNETVIVTLAPNSAYNIDTPGNATVTIASDDVSSAPDLVETTVTNPSATAKRGGRFSVTDTAKNQGTAPARGSTTRYYLSLDRLKSSGDKRLTGSRAVSSLAPGAKAAGTVTVTIPSTTTVGSYYRLACADDAKVVAESNESNNCKASTTKVKVNP
ncbi:MAG: CARDB domain-containing protein, partial [Nitrososphaera sp.]